MKVIDMVRLHIKPFLDESGVSGNQLAVALGVSRNTVTNWLKGSDRGSFEHLVQLRDFFSMKLNRQITVDDLLKQEDR